MIEVKSKILPKVKVHGPTFDHVDGYMVAKAIGAERIEAFVSTKRGSIFRLWQVLFKYLKLFRLTR